jgi:cytochrome P450 / NADPH-cytochrome P450 reductase
MHDIASQLVLKWARQAPEYRIPVSESFSHLTLDTIALCAMDYRFNSFYQEEQHPFVQAMNNTLGARSNRGQLSGMLRGFLPSYNEQLRKDGEFQQKTATDLVQFRRDHPTDKKDLLNAMIYGKDPKTGKTMRDDLIAANMLTFLIAGNSPLDAPKG